MQFQCSAPTTFRQALDCLKCLGYLVLSDSGLSRYARLPALVE
jgi:hypothetical protein